MLKLNVDEIHQLLLLNSLPSHFSRASIAVNCLDRLHQTKKRGLVPCSLYLTLITSKVKHHFMTLCRRGVGKFAFFSSLSLSLAKVFFKSCSLMYGGCLSYIKKKVWTLQICTFQNVPTNYSFFLSNQIFVAFLFWQILFVKSNQHCIPLSWDHSQVIPFWTSNHSRVWIANVMVPKGSNLKIKNRISSWRFQYYFILQYLMY